MLLTSCFTYIFYPAGLIARIGVVIPKSFMGERLEKEDELPLQKHLVSPFWNAVLKLLA